MQRLASLLFKLSFGLTALFMLIIGAIRAQPYVPPADVLALYDLFNDCESPPCVLAIYVGMPADEATARLEASPWVANITEVNLGQGNQTLRWQWSQDSPQWILRDSSYGYVDFFPENGNTVGKIEIMTRISYGDVWLTEPNVIPMIEREWNPVQPSIESTLFVLHFGYSAIPHYSCGVPPSSVWSVNRTSIELPNRIQYDSYSPSEAEATINRIPYLCRQIQVVLSRSP
ncbi:MAG: hypothetical protein U0670_16625 [Anaerolineae bacterium]